MSQKAISQISSQKSQMSEGRRERLVEIQKREQLRGLLVNKFKAKYGNHSAISKYIENAVQKFLTNDRLTESNLKNLDSTIANEANNRERKSQILDDHKSQRSQSAHSQVSRKSYGAKSNGGLSHQALSQLNKRNGDAGSQVGSQTQSVRSKRSVVSAHSQRSGSFMSQKSKVQKSQYSEINENDEWEAIMKFNTLLHYEEQKQTIMREAERKKLIKQELDRQVKAKADRQ